MRAGKCMTRAGKWFWPYIFSEPESTKVVQTKPKKILKVIGSMSSFMKATIPGTHCSNIFNTSDGQ